MGFVKLDSGLLTSTLWAHREQREVFITALLMAEPTELLEFTPTLRVDCLEEGGYLVPPGWYGFVPAPGPGILRQALVKTAPGMAALRALGEPDPESRSKDHDGRRMVRVDGGFILLNYFKYRDRDYTAPERMRRYRARQKGVEQSVTPVTRNIRNGTRNDTQAEAEAEYRVQAVPPYPLTAPPSAPAAKAPRVKKLKTTELKPESVEPFQAAWDTMPATVMRWDQGARRDLECTVAKGSRAEAERNFQGIVDAGLATPRTLYVAFFAYLTEGDGPKKGYIQHMATFFGPKKRTYLEWLDRGRVLEAERYGRPA